MTAQEDRQKMMEHIEQACREGARLKPACEMAGALLHKASVRALVD